MRSLRVTVLALVGAALPLASYWALVRPDRALAIEAAERRLEAKQKQLVTIRALADRLPQFQAEQRALQERLALVDTIRPVSGDEAVLVERLRDLASAEGLDQVSIEELSAGTKGPTLPVSFRAQGAASAVVALLGRLPRIARMVRLERLELESLEGGRYGLVLRLVAFRDTTSS
jgi:Tfp pilus assembly protein PilO